MNTAVPRNKALSPTLTLLMSAATGLMVASNYYAQPLLDAIANAFMLSPNQAGFIVTAAQLGYAVGLLLLVPLGDMLERRGLIVGMSLLSAAGMLITASSSSLWVMILGTALTGMFSVAAQVLVPLAATLASPETRGKVVGTVMSGLLLGILLARTLAGALASLGGWRMVYWVASVLMIALSLLLWRALPRYKQDNQLNYPQLLSSIFHLMITYKPLRIRSILGGLTFANFSILWTSMAFLLSAPPYRYSEGVIGLFGLVGAAGALAATRAGRLADHGHARTVMTVGLVVLALSWLPIAAGVHSILPLVIGILALDLTVQGVHVTNQSIIYRDMPEARNRITSGYMTAYFIGGALGSMLSAMMFQYFGWLGVSAAGFLTSLTALLVWWYNRNDVS
ncbi:MULTISPECIES: MFS transporter [Lonsdalea]|uniref:Transporter n=2 Tax=Lonsdalea TaxID=1082702 RepID=A0ACD1JAR4_9GAMM|nr:MULTISPECIES: MFS transporter [Lonsdalea]RAT12030.1 transporter [Lonsdalea quercina]RAT18665.1 transporter [Lonsdalea populi]RAT25937.1 transporter [Lonsdalea populi]RAT27192.1 transporter [Lonsdalea populi]RAT33067.1 transporter [Lonsdalea populi]